MTLRPSQSAFAILFSSALAACSGGSGTVPDAPDAGDAATSDPDAAVVTLDASAPDAASPDGGAKAPIDPIGAGYEWRYDVKILGYYPLCTAGAQKGTVVGTMMHQGKPGFRIQSLCPSAGVSDYAVEGDRVWVRVSQIGDWELALDAPVAEGHTWTNAYGSFVWHAIPKETVGGKLQDECWQAKDQNGPSYTNYCRGIGPTRWHIEDKLGNGYDAVLTGVNF